uniref:uncharacterized protein LOC120334325 n=1 Tax=Styela clava TaxID=7725 RepID=UPI0019394013|nr:uncharacterized protein LOC120334325 [Styela clava]
MMKQMNKMVKICLVLLGYLMVKTVGAVDFSNTTTISNKEGSSAESNVALPTPPYPTTSDPNSVHIYHFSDLLDRMPDYDYYLLNPGDVSRDEENFHDNTFMFWGCFKKSNVIMKGKRANSNSQNGKSNIGKCRTICSLNGKCQMWSFNHRDTDDSDCYYKMKTDNLNELKVVSSQDARLEFRTCHSGYVGCYIGIRNRGNAEFVTTANGVHSCINKCEQMEYPYAIFKDSKYCECANLFPDLQITDKNVKCILPSKSSDRFAVYKTGSEFADTTLCIIGSNMDYETENSIYHTGISSIQKCKKLCMNFQDHGKTCLMWWYNMTHCKIILKTVHKGFFVKSSNSFIGFATCGKEDNVNNVNCADDTSNDNSAEERNTKIAFAAVFCAVVIFLLLAIAYVCGCLRLSKVNSKSQESSKDFSNSNTMQNDIHYVKNQKHEFAGVNGKKLKIQKPKRRYVNVFSKPGISFITAHNNDPKKQYPDGQGTELTSLTQKNSNAAGCAHETEYVTLETYNEMKNNNNYIKPETTAK